MAPDELFRRLDRIAGGRHAAYRIDADRRDDPRIVTAFRRVAWLLAALFLVGGGAVAEAVEVTATGGTVSTLVWWRLIVIFGIASTLFYFRWRARLGWWWAYSRLRLFSIVFPVVAVSTSLVPGLYPGWMVIEQLSFSALLLVVWWVLSREPVHTVYARPSRSSQSVRSETRP